MKIIDLLNKIANGEEVPKKIKIGNKIYNYETFNIGKGDNYFTAEWGEVKGYRINYGGTYYYLEIRDYNLNDEVEIIEDKPFNERVEEIYNKHIDYIYNKEDKKIEKINIHEDGGDTGINGEYMPYKQFRVIAYKINEIIDYINRGD